RGGGVRPSLDGDSAYGLASAKAAKDSKAYLGYFSALWTLLVFGRYAEVTAPALYGRDINLYWDVRFIPDVVAMMTRVAPAWLIVVSAAGAGTAIAMLYALVALAWRSVATAMFDARVRRVLMALSAAAIVACAGRLAI